MKHRQRLHLCFQNMKGQMYFYLDFFKLDFFSAILSSQQLSGELLMPAKKPSNETMKQQVVKQVKCFNFRGVFRQFSLHFQTKLSLNIKAAKPQHLFLF